MGNEYRCGRRAYPPATSRGTSPANAWLRRKSFRRREFFTYTISVFHPFVVTSPSCPARGTALMGVVMAVGVELGWVVDSVVGVALGDGLGDGDVDVEGDGVGCGVSGSSGVIKRGGTITV